MNPHFNTPLQYRYLFPISDARLCSPTPPPPYLPELYSIYSTMHSGIHVFECVDARAIKNQMMNMVCSGTCFQLLTIIHVGSGLTSIPLSWPWWADLPAVLWCDGGLHNRGVLEQFCGVHGIQVTHASLESRDTSGHRACGVG